MSVLRRLVLMYEAHIWASFFSPIYKRLLQHPPEGEGVNGQQ